mmetsp:Transcript_62152/g.183744  ORF Transcript_62152/g.183744 Transcript_62152/m.183744 type:complete len:94 (+) Transcript_62152:583-864(+)
MWSNKSMNNYSLVRMQLVNGIFSSFLSRDGTCMMQCEDVSLGISGGSRQVALGASLSVFFGHINCPHNRQGNLGKDNPCQELSSFISLETIPY